MCLDRKTSFFDKREIKSEYRFYAKGGNNLLDRSRTRKKKASEIDVNSETPWLFSYYGKWVNNPHFPQASKSWATVVAENTKKAPRLSFIGIRFELSGVCHSNQHPPFHNIYRTANFRTPDAARISNCPP